MVAVHFSFANHSPTQFPVLNLAQHASVHSCLNCWTQQIVSILIVNVYLPTNYGSDESTTTFREAIAELEGFLLTQTYDRVVITGDFNVDFAKDGPNRTILECFMQAFDLVRGDICSDISFTYRRDDHQSFSWVDHVICSSAILNTISNIISTDSADNFSDHLPVFFTLNCSALSTHIRPISIGQTNSTSDSLSTKINWSKITEDDIRNFQHLLQHNLPSLSSSAHSCIDPQCSTHKDIIDHCCNQLLVAIDLAAHACFPKILPRKARRVPGWNDKAKSLRQNGTEYGRSVAVRLLEYYQQLRKTLKAAISMKSVSKDKLIISRVRNWLGLGAIHVPMIFGT